MHECKTSLTPETIVEVTRNEIDSAALGKTVLELGIVGQPSGFGEAERDYVAQYRPAYVVCKVPVEDLGTIHAMEDFGFRFLEFQFRLCLNLPNRAFPTQPGYRCEVVTREEDLEPVLEIAGTTFVADRFSADPAIPPGISGERYKQYVWKSFRSENEQVRRTVVETTGETIGFLTYRILSATEILLLIGGVPEQHKRSPLSGIGEHLVLNAFREQGIRKIYTHISGRNYPVANHEIRGFQFRVEAGFVVLRKTYSQP